MDRRRRDSKEVLEDELKVSRQTPGEQAGTNPVDRTEVERSEKGSQIPLCDMVKIWESINGSANINEWQLGGDGGEDVNTAVPCLRNELLRRKAGGVRVTHDVLTPTDIRELNRFVGADSGASAEEIYKFLRTERKKHGLRQSALYGLLKSLGYHFCECPPPALLVPLIRRAGLLWRELGGVPRRGRAKVWVIVAEAGGGAPRFWDADKAQLEKRWWVEPPQPAPLPPAKPKNAAASPAPRQPVVVVDATTAWRGERRKVRNGWETRPAATQKLQRDEVELLRWVRTVLLPAYARTSPWEEQLLLLVDDSMSAHGRTRGCSNVVAGSDARYTRATDGAYWVARPTEEQLASVARHRLDIARSWVRTEIENVMAEAGHLVVFAPRYSPLRSVAKCFRDLFVTSAALVGSPTTAESDFQLTMCPRVREKLWGGYKSG